VNSHLIILGLGFLRARLFSLQSFYNYARGHCEAARELLQSYALCSSDQCRTVTALARGRELFWGMFARGDGGWRGSGAAGRGYNEILALEVRNVV